MGGRITVEFAIILAQKAEHDGLFSNLTGGRAGRLRPCCGGEMKIVRTGIKPSVVRHPAPDGGRQEAGAQVMAM